MNIATKTNTLDLLQWRQQISELYAFVREQQGSSLAHATWCNDRDDLFLNHPQSPLDIEQKKYFEGLDYFDYNPAFRVQAIINQNVEPEIFQVDVGEDGVLTYQRVGTVHFMLPTGRGTLSLFWILGYGGGIFIPFRDTTNGTTTYGAGRYLYDTIKGADLGIDGNKIILDFNFAYHPSCAYHDYWVCPLAPQENRLNFEIPAGEKLLV